MAVHTGRPLAKWTAILGILALSAAPAGACNVPVFRWALQNWQPDMFEAIVFHRGPLDANAKAVLDFLEKASADEKAMANIFARGVDATAKMDEPLAKIWAAHAKQSLPRMVLLRPPGFWPDGTAAVWAGAPTMEAAKAILDSPVRREVAKRLIKGDTAVWIVMGSGDRSKDDALVKLVDKTLKEAEKTVELPPQLPQDYLEMAPDEEDPADAQPAVPELKVAFSTVRLSRTDAGERTLVKMLMGIEPDLATKYASEPMAFPIFGRGRALCALVGKGINADNILDVCHFLVGPCSCMVKEQNPGSDVLIRADWDKAFEGEAFGEIQSPALTGVMASADVGEPALAAPVAPTVAQTDGGSLVRNVLIAVALAAGAVGVFSVVVARRLSRS